ncbi:pYEATS domain-containing protein [Knoellia aerolata]|uniref:Prokaryotic YEATS domain-containing protein n=1 Tax=Knoellia aerolata DSM 18566 TaxID=1385519 RepID=A0A0A0JR60_9MICO|nr:pYEATS domain-containing protein [Knoellia aerolata]KGN39940.1 hypothetical protein N801_17695 [Knoellia aerolata DSM 18566]
MSWLVAEPVGKDAKKNRLTRLERLGAAVVGLVLLGIALFLLGSPPSRQVALAQCRNAAAGCIVSVDSDLTNFAAVVAGLGAAAALIALLGVRFTEVKAAGAEFKAAQETAGLAAGGTELKPDELPEEAPAGGEDPRPAELILPVEVPIAVTVVQGLGERGQHAPIAITKATPRLSEVNPELLRDYQSARKVSQGGYFLTHALSPATTAGQKYSVAIRVTPHPQKGMPPPMQVRAASFFLGRAWGNRVIPGLPGSDGRLGIVTQAYGPFLALCEVEFTDGSRILLDHYCDFDMGSLVPTT